MLAAGRSNQAIAREPAATLDAVKSMRAPSWASSARPAAPRPWPGPQLSLIFGRVPPQPRPGHYIPATARHQHRARLHLGARCSPEDSTRHAPSG